MASIKLINISKFFGKRKVLDDINLDIKDGEFIVLLGPSGCGKTTLLRIIAGLENQSSGNVYIDGKNVNNLSPKDRNIAMIFQNYALYPHMTVEDNILFGLRLRKVPKKEQKMALEEVTKMLDIADLLERKPGELSGGQRQRVAMARAIVRRPSLFLMDEPLSNLDAKLRYETRFNIKKLQKELKTTTIYVTHDQVEAMALADRIAIINGGKIVQFGSPVEIYHRPANMFIANFIGNPPMNFIKVNCIGRDKFQFSNGVIIEISLNAKEYLDREVFVLGIRPEDIEIVSDSNNKKACCFKGRIILTELLGGEVVIHAKIGPQDVKIKKTLDGIQKLEEEITLRFDSQKIYLFDHVTGKCIKYPD